MWIAKFKLQHENDIFTTVTKKYNVNFYAYPLSHYKKEEKYFFVLHGFIEGSVEGKEKFLLQLKQEKRIKKIERKKDYLTIFIQYHLNDIEKAELKKYYDPAIIHTEPVLNSKDGWEYWSIASFEKEPLITLINSAKRKHKGKLLSITNKPFDRFSITGVSPHISNKQREIIMIAFKEGYYDYPRKISVKNLAKMIGLSYSTCQEHLRKAEKALLPSLIKLL